MGILKAVAFDLDGTLYPNYRIYRRLFPILILHPYLLNKFMKVRRELHALKDESLEDGASFYDRQAAFMARILGKGIEETKLKIERMVYKNWEKHFSGIELFPYVKETLSAFRDAGLRLALLSDFPPAKKLVELGLDSYFDLVLCSEDTGKLKPSPVPFAALIKGLALPPKEILYVGNSVHFDVEGSLSAGMQAALIRRGLFSTGRVSKNSTKKADFVFRDYRQLQEYVLR